MEALALILVIVVLVVVHELGHFMAAKATGMEVDEFGIGYPPRAATLGKIGETTYTLNWIPFGGFVKIRGEDGKLDNEARDPKAFTSKNRLAQAIVLVAGIVMNLLLAYALFVGSLLTDTQRALEPGQIATAQDVQLIVVNVLPGSPADVAGLKQYDTILSANTQFSVWKPSLNDGSVVPTPESFTQYISESGGRVMQISVDRNGASSSVTAEPTRGIVSTDPTRYALGVEVVTIGIVPITVLEALDQGVSLTWGAVVLTANGLARFFYSIFSFSADLSQVSGPVGIAGVVGDATEQGVGSLLWIMAIISINLALINLIPIPALDGGRLLFVIIESITRRPIKAKVAQAVNTVGFVLLILLMLVVTANDIFKLVG